jgi:ABC-type lipoprotein release transport system permease subunit
VAPARYHASGGGQAAWPAAVGIPVGLAGADAATRVLESFLFETRPTDPATLVTTVLLLAVTAGVAAWIPARRAALVDPVIALRTE